MKALVRLTVMLVVVALVLPLATVGAQGGEGDELLAPEISAVYFQTATSGAFADNGDGTYTLTLEGVGPEIVWIMNTPVLSVQRLDNTNFNTQWGSAEGLEGEAVLEINGLNVLLTLSAPTYDGAAVQTYQAVVTDIVAAEETKDAPELPMSFENAYLSIVWSVDFQNGLVAGIEAMYEGMRATPEQCAAAQTAWNNFLAWDAVKKAEYQAASVVCYGSDLATQQSGCDQMKAIQQERNAAIKAVTPSVLLLATECK